MQFEQYSRLAILLKKIYVFGQKFENEFEIWIMLSIISKILLRQINRCITTNISDKNEVQLFV